MNVNTALNHIGSYPGVVTVGIRLMRIPEALAAV